MDADPAEVPHDRAVAVEQHRELAEVGANRSGHAAVPVERGSEDVARRDHHLPEPSCRSRAMRCRARAADAPQRVGDHPIGRNGKERRDHVDAAEAHAAHEPRYDREAEQDRAPVSERLGRAGAARERRTSVAQKSRAKLVIHAMTGRYIARAWSAFDASKAAVSVASSTTPSGWPVTNQRQASRRLTRGSCSLRARSLPHAGASVPRPTRGRARRSGRSRRRPLHRRRRRLRRRSLRASAR
ncbi:MAG: hypothetical protein RIT45_2778 [Pseudomonadota bacterium]